MAAITFASATGVLVLDSSLKAFSIDAAKGAAARAVLVLVSILAAIVSFWAARILLRPSDGRHLGTARQHIVPGLIALVGFSIPYIVLAVEALVGGRRTIVGTDDLVVDPRDAQQAKLEHEQAVAAWQRRIEAHNLEQERARAALEGWRVVPVSETVRTVCVFGGTAKSWAAALTTLGASLLGNGHRVAIVDLSGRLSMDELCDGCRQVGVPAFEAAFPDSATADALLAELSWDELGEVLAEMRHAAQQDPHVSQSEREADRGVIRRVSECLDGRVSIARLRRALLVLGNDEIDRGGAAGIEARERDRLLALRTKLDQEHGGRSIERVAEIELALRGAESSLRTEPHDGVDGSRGLAAADACLLAIGIDKRNDQLRNERCATLLFELLARRARLGQLPVEALMVLGADRIRARKLESVLDATDDGGIRTFLFFENLRGDSIDLVGARGAAAAFLTLGNHRQAHEAVEFIGSKHKMVIAEQTVSAGESLDRTRGWEQGRSKSLRLGLPPAASVGLSRSSSRSYAETFGQNVSYTRSEQRVREDMIEPWVLMGLPLTEMIYVEVLPGGERKTWNVDCHPEVARSMHPAV